MAAKTIQLSNDGVSNWLDLPGSTGDLTVETNQLEDTIFGAEYTSQFPGIKSWNVSTNAIFKGTAGYCAKVQKTGTATSFTGESTSQVGTSQVYEIDDRSKSVWDWTSTITVNDGGSPVADADIEKIYHVQGQVEFVSGFTPVGAITVDGDYLPLTEFGRANSVSLTQSADTTETTDFETACSNGGWQTIRPTLLTADLEISGFYRATNGLFDLLVGEEQFVVEIDPKGDGETTARGIYRPASDSQSGDVGGDEEETFSLSLSVPEGVVPFRWRFTSASAAPEAIQLAQNKWGTRESLFVRYLPDGVGEEGREGECFVTDLSLEVAVDGVPEYSLTLDGTDALSKVNA